MSDEIDRICEEMEAADEKTAGEIIHSLTKVQMHEVAARMAERARRAQENLARLKRVMGDIDA